jgi:biotin carboxyl carrier protein
MKLDLQINGAPAVFDLLAANPDCRFRMDGASEQSAQVETPEPGVYSVLLDGRSFDAFVEERPEGLVVTIDGHRFEVAAHDPRQWTARSRDGAAGGARSIASPMPGKVVRVLVAEGDQVGAGQGLVVVEAMKMQNELKAPGDGRVVSVAAREGATVAAGEVLVTLE